MLPKKYKLNLRDEKNRSVLRSRQKVSGSGLVVSFDFLGGVDWAQLAVIISKKALSLAVARNNLRRQILRTAPTTLLEIPQLRIVVRANSQQAATISQQDLKDLFFQVEKKALEK